MDSILARVQILIDKGFLAARFIRVSGYNEIYENGAQSGLLSDPEIYSEYC